MDRTFPKKLEDEDSVVCSPVINFLGDTDAGGPGPRCQTYCSLVKINKLVYNLLFNTKIKNLCEGTKNEDYELEEGFVLQKHELHHNTILLGEYGFTRVLLENNLKISCLLYENVDYSDKKNWIKYSDRIDRTNNYKNHYLEKNAYL